jgi:hypothetical protein
MPSPNKYNPNDQFDSKKESAAKISFGKDAWSRDKKIMSPGPGEYTNFPKKPSHFYIGEKLVTKRSDFSPGPAAYVPKADSVMKQNPSYPLDKAPRGNTAGGRTFSPGPGAYNLWDGLFAKAGGMIGNSGRG